MLYAVYVVKVVSPSRFLQTPLTNKRGYMIPQMMDKSFYMGFQRLKIITWGERRLTKTFASYQEIVGRIKSPNTDLEGAALFKAFRR